MKNSQLACVFPGQGSQQVGMLKDLADLLPEVGQTFELASAVLGYDLWQLVQEGPQEQLNLTEFAQPALLTASTAIWRAWQRCSPVTPAFVAGHSLGEWSALVAAGVVDFTDAVTLVSLRGRYMQAAVPAGEGAMAAVLGLADELVIKACAQATYLGEVAAVNFNSPGQVVIAGQAAAVEKAMQLAQEFGAKRVLLLPVSAPFHTALMRPAADQLAQHVAKTPFKSPLIPIVHNVHARPESDPAAIKALMIEQIYSPVLWVGCVETLVAEGVSTLLEIGPGKVLSGLNKRIDKNLHSLSSGDSAAWASALELFN